MTTSGINTGSTAESRICGFDKKNLGPLEFVRFMQQIEPGDGDYTRDRHQWIDGLSVDQNCATNSGTTAAGITI